MGPRQKNWRPKNNTSKCPRDFGQVRDVIAKIYVIANSELEQTTVTPEHVNLVNFGWSTNGEKRTVSFDQPKINFFGRS